MKGTRIAAAAVVIAAAAFIGYRFLDQEEAEVIYESRPTVTAETPRQEDIILYTELIGTVEPVSKADVIPKMAGEVLEVNFQAGDHVEAGQILCRLDSDALTSLKLNVDSAQLTLAEAAITKRGRTVCFARTSVREPGSGILLAEGDFTFYCLDAS